MLSKNEIKDIQSLRHKKFRREAGRFTVEGPKIVEELIALVPQKMRAVYATEEWPAPPGAQVMRIPHATLEKISQLATPNQVVAVVEDFDSQPPESGRILYLDGIQDPGNLGTIIRIADWFGLPHIVCGPGTADMYNAKVIQSSMASIARVNIWYDEADEWIAAFRGQVVAATLQGGTLKNAGFNENSLLMIGNESKGLRQQLVDRASLQVTIPRTGRAESLNAAVATGIILSHLVT